MEIEILFHNNAVHWCWWCWSPCMQLYASKQKQTRKISQYFGYSCFPADRTTNGLGSGGDRKMHAYYSSFSSFPQFSTSFFTLPFCLPSNLILYPFLLHVVSPYSAYSVNAFHRQTHQVKYFSYFLTIFQRFHIFISFTCFPPTDWIV